MSSSLNGFAARARLARENQRKQLAFVHNPHRLYKEKPTTHVEEHKAHEAGSADYNILTHQLASKALHVQFVVEKGLI